MIPPEWADTVLGELARRTSFLPPLDPGPPLTRRQRARNRRRARLLDARERVAVRIAPWLRGRDD